jgi:hypothetical protein
MDMEDFDITGETVLVSPTRVVVYEQMVDSSDRGVWRFVFSMDTVEKTLLPWSEFTADYNAFLSGLFVRQEEDDKPAWFVAKYGGLPLKYQFTITT